MALPTAYTEDTFKAYLHAALRDVADVLGWTVEGGDYNEILNDVLFGYEANDIVTITGRDNLRKLRALGRVALWRAVAEATAGDYDFQADGGRYSRSQLHAMAQDNLDQAVTEALVYDPNYQIEITGVTHQDYYWPPDLDDDYYARDDDDT